MRIVVTGAAGFVGRPLCRALQDGGHNVTAVTRKPDGDELHAERIVAAGDLADAPGWNDILKGSECVVHLAGRAHTTDDDPSSAERLYEFANVSVTEDLARAAIAAGVRRLVYVSSIKVNGERTFGRPFSASDAPAPQDAYGRSKARAEERLRAISGGDLDVVVLRPPLMYGPGVRGNLRTLFRWAARGLPLPIAAIDNRRDILAVTNFVDLIGKTVSSAEAAGRTLLARDGTPVSTPALYAGIAEALGRKARMLACPVSALTFLGRAAGRQEMVARLVGDLEVDDGETRRLLDWRPPVDMATELAATARSFSGRL